jgi:hypothetical protein
MIAGSDEIRSSENHLSAIGKKVGLLMNFNVERPKDGIISEN